MMNKRPEIAIGLLLMVIVGCRWGGNRADSKEVVLPPTEVGAPTGDAVSAGMGPNGGTISSADGRLTLTVPKGAIAETITFSIQPITNKAGGGIGSAYRLEPRGRTFATPLEMTIRYDDADIEGSTVEALAMAYQDEQRAWHLANVTRTDESAKTITLSATHFSDWAFLAKVHISPQKATLRVGKSLNMEIGECMREDQLDWFTRHLEPTSSVCHLTDGQYKWGLHADWYADAGTIDDHGSTKIVYTAPAKKPSPNVVTISYPYWVNDDKAGHRGMFTAHITIVDGAYRASGHDGPNSYSGIICSLDDSFTISGTNGLTTFPMKFFPTNGTSGTLTFLGSWKAITMSGTGNYTVEGADTDKPRIIAQTNTTLTIAGQSRSGSGPAHIDLTPLDDGSCD